MLRLFLTSFLLSSFCYAIDIKDSLPKDFLEKSEGLFENNSNNKLYRGADVHNSDIGLIEKYINSVSDKSYNIPSLVPHIELAVKKDQDTSTLLLDNISNWELFFQNGNNDFTNRTVVEMVYQVLINFSSIFNNGFYLNRFGSNSIGVVENVNPNEIYKTPSKFFSSSNYAFTVINLEDLKTECNFSENEQFKILEESFIKHHERSFSHKTEEKIEICKHLNIYNLMMFLQTGLYKAANIELQKDSFFRGCLDEEEDKGLKCPPIVKLVLNLRLNQKGKTDSSYLTTLKQLRVNFLRFKTSHFLNWFNIFVNDMLSVFKLRSEKTENKQLVTAYNKLNQSNSIIHNLYGQLFISKYVITTEYTKKVTQVVNMIEQLRKLIINVKRKESQEKNAKKDFSETEKQRLQEQGILTESKEYEFDEGEQLAFVQRINKEGQIFISMEVNLSMINPADFGFDNYNPEIHQKELNEKVKKFFVEELSQNEEFKQLGMNVERRLLI